MLDYIVAQAPVFLLIAARILALIMTTPLLSTKAVSRVVKIALGGLTAFVVFPSVSTAGWNVPAFSFDYVLLLIGEVMIGIITGLFVSMIFSTFSTAGQFFSYQMGFGASEVYDALAQIENPLLGQFLNLIAMFTFLQIDGFRSLFLGGILRSFQALNVSLLISAREHFLSFLLGGLSKLFLNAMIIVLPIVGTLFLITLSTGLLSKAAPQINLLSEGLPITMLVAFILMFACMPLMVNLFIQIINNAFSTMQEFFIFVGGIG